MTWTYWWHDKPEWLRWVLLLPVVVVAQALTLWAITWPTFFMQFHKFDLVWYKAVDGALSTYIFLSLWHELPPRFNKIFPRIVFGLITIGCLLATLRFAIRTWEHTLTWNDSGDAAQALGFLIAGGFTLRDQAKTA